MSPSDSPDFDNAKPLDAIQDRASQLLDETNQPLDSVTLTVTASDKRAFADLQWLDALLRTKPAEDAHLTNVGISNVLTRIIEDTRPYRVELAARKAVGLPTWQKWLVSWSAAAALVILGIVAWQLQPKSAYAVVEQALSDSRQAGDRVYLVTLSGGSLSTGERQARLTVQGGTKFVYEAKGPLGFYNRVGSDGHDRWFVPAAGPVLVSQTNRFLPDWVAKSDSHLPFLQLTAALERMREQYALQRLPNEALMANGPVFQHLKARLAVPSDSSGNRLPTEIELWSEQQQGVIHRLQLSWPTTQHRLAPHRIRLDLTGQAPTLAEPYDFRSFATQRTVIQLDRPETQSQTPQSEN